MKTNNCLLYKQGHHSCDVTPTSLPSAHDTIHFFNYLHNVTYWCTEELVNLYRKHLIYKHRRYDLTLYRLDHLLKHPIEYGDLNGCCIYK